MALVPDTTLTLGDVSFASYEVPERISFGGAQRLAVHKVIGGARVVDALGPDDAEICWSGRFQSPNAGPRARHLDYLRRQGTALTLSWDQFSYSVVISRFAAEFERYYQIPYRIACLVVEDDTQPVTTSPSTPVDELVAEDAAELASLASSSGNSGIAGSTGQLQALLASSAPLAAASAGTLAALESLLAELAALIAAAIAAAAPAFDGGASAGSGAAALLGQSSAAAALAILLEMQALAGRIACNLRRASPAASGRTITVAGGNLFSIAAALLGDATQWSRIAALNGLTDPVLAGITQLRLPPIDTSAGG